MRIGYSLNCSRFSSPNKQDLCVSVPTGRSNPIAQRAYSKFLHAMTCCPVCIARNTMQGDVSSPEEISSTSTSTPRPEDASVIRAACESDMQAIVEVETISFPQVYANARDLTDYRRREIEGAYPCYRILVASSEHSEQTAIRGFVVFESYLHSCREYCDSKTGEGIALPANRLLDRKPAYSTLMAATRADPALLDEEFLCASIS
jgi:hypothetical protein